MLSKILMLSLFLPLSLSANCDSVENIRNDYHNLKTEEKLEAFLEKYKNSPCQKSKPYVASATMQQAEHTMFPHKKLKYFNAGKKQLESFIKKNPNDIEGRYVRLLVQSQIPKILGYKGNMTDDKKFIEDHLSGSGLPTEYQAKMKKTIKSLDI